MSKRMYDYRYKYVRVCICMYEIVVRVTLDAFIVRDHISTGNSTPLGHLCMDICMCEHIYIYIYIYTRISICMRKIERVYIPLLLPGYTSPL